MKLIRAVMVEDEPKSARLLGNLLRDYAGHVEIIAEAATVKSAIKAIEVHQPALVFLDLEMPDGSGFDVLDSLQCKKPEVIVVTAFNHYTLPAIRHSVVDYLMKPIDIDELVTAVNKLPFRNNRPEKPLQDTLAEPGHSKIALPVFDGLFFISVSDIVYIRSEGSYTRFFLSNGTNILVSRNMGEYEHALPPSLFCRIHNEYIVNLNCITRYIRGRGGYVILQDGSSICVSARKKDDFLRRFM